MALAISCWEILDAVIMLYCLKSMACWSLAALAIYDLSLSSLEFCFGKLLADAIVAESSICI